MKNVSIVVVLVWIVGGLFLFRSGNCYISSFGPEMESTHAIATSAITYSYDRIDEVKKQCGAVLSSATELKPQDSRIYSLIEDLTLVNGDWSQDVGKAPIMPYLDRKVRGNYSDFQSPLNMVSFWVTDIDRDHQSKKYVSVNGLLVMRMTLDSYMDRPYEGSPEFQMWPGNTQLSISFQGIYTESKKNGGERVLCLLGSTMLPSRDSESSDPWEWAKGSGSHYRQPPLLQDDQIFLVLRYPSIFTLTTRVIRGEMKSLNSKTKLKYFDDIHILSQLGKSGNYKFGSEKFVSRACDPYPNEDGMMNGGVDIYKGDAFCDILGQITGEGAGSLDIVPNWRCNGTDDFCSKLGPFMSDKDIKATDGGFNGVKLAMQTIKCEQRYARGNITTARVAAVFRVVPPMENQYAEAMRSGISNTSVAAEGIWQSSNGQLCMVGCLGLVDTEGSTCYARLCLYIPFSFSIKQRSILLGSIASTEKNSPFFPLSFEKLLRPTELWNYFRSSHPYYSYSKIEKAGAILEKNEPFSFGSVIKKSLLQFPKLEDTDALMNSLSLLAEDLTLHSSAFSDPPPSTWKSSTDFQLEILSLDSMFGRYWSMSNASFVDEQTPYHIKTEYTEKQLLMNVSAQISIQSEAYSNFSMLLLEGLYDPRTGKMYLVGCRDVRASWKILFDSSDLEAGLDCLIEVIVSYPPTTVRWLVNPTAKVSISSQRNDDDPLHFSSIKLQTLPIMYRKQREDILSRRGVEGILRILTLSFAIGCITSQIFYIRSEAEAVPFMSLVMLGAQALGYSHPLITGAEALFRRKSSESYETSYDLESNQWIHVIDYTVKLLVLVSFLLTIRLCQRVWKSRARLLNRSSGESNRVPSDKWVLLATSIIHVIGYVIVLIIQATKSSQKPIQMHEYIDPTGNSQTLRDWEMKLEEYVGLVQDFFLLPQVIGNILWQVDCKPLRKLYFIGITLVRLLPHVYDYIRSPVSNPYFANENEFVNPNMDFYSKFGDIAIPATAVFLAAAVYIQQRWNYDKLSQTLKIGRYRLLPLGSRMYQRLPSKSLEAELSSVGNGNNTSEARDDDDE